MSTSAAEIHTDPSRPGTLVIEAATAEAALGAVHEHLGPDAEILSADRVTRGGLGGFFARELVQLTAKAAGTPPVPTTSVRPPDLTDVAMLRAAEVERTAAAPAAPAPAPAPAPASRPAAPPVPTPTPVAAPVAASSAANGATVLDNLLTDLVARAGTDEQSFAEVLRGRMPELAHAEAAASAGPAAAPAPAAPAAAAPAAPLPAAPSAAPAGGPAARPAAGPGEQPSEQPSAQPPSGAEALHQDLDVAPARPVLRHAVADDLPLPEPEAPRVDWSMANLQRLGLPLSVLDGVRGLDPRDDAAWVAGLSRGVSTLTRPLPAGPAAYAGPRAGKLAAALGVPVIAVGEEPPAGRPFAVASRGGAQACSWLAWNRGRRWLHVVIGGEGWRPLLFDEPLAVSWVGEESLCEAIRLCAELGLVLGYGLGTGRGAKPRRATPLEIALAVRDLLPQR